MQIKFRAWRIKTNTDTTMGDKLRTLAAKIDAIEQYNNKYANPDKVGRIDSYQGQKNYKYLKELIKEELQQLVDRY